MKSQMGELLKLEHHPVAVIHTDERPEGALQFKKKKFGCAIDMAVQVAKGRTAVFEAETTSCTIGASSLGFGKGFDSLPFDDDLYYGSLAIGNQDKAGLKLKFLLKIAEAAGIAPPNSSTMVMEGEGYKANRELVRRYIEELPDLRIPERYVVMKPLAEVDPQREKVVVVVLFVNSNQLAALVTLANFAEEGVDRVLVHSGTACQSTILYPYLQGDEDRPKASVGLTDLAIRAEQKRFLGDGLLTFAMPYKMFLEMEGNAGISCLVRQSWKDLSG
jgi:uncharacterized protein (DUF169 family)